MTQPVYCRECKGRDTFKREPAGDYLAESGRAYMLRWRCEVCGHTTMTSNPEFAVGGHTALTSAFNVPKRESVLF